MATPARRAVARACALAVSAAALLGGAPQASAHDAAVGITHTDRLPAGVKASSVKASASASAGGLPAAWCGTRTSRDQDINSSAAGSASIKFVYAYPADRPNRSGQIARMLQSTAREVGLFLAGEAGGRKTIRFDLGTRCGPRYLDIATVKLAKPRAAYIRSGQVRSDDIRAEVLRSLGLAGGPRNYLVYVDNLVAGASFGQAEGIFSGGDEPGPDNPNNAGGRFGYVWSQDGATLGLADTAHLVLHELSHTLGAVQMSAPNTTGAGHCRDATDVMCYSDGGPRGGVFSACAPLDGVITEHFDCNKDDYFNPAPAAGSYLDRHWNVYDSDFLGSCRELALECGKPALAAGRSKRR
jgi:hypothetical protein